MAKPKKPKSESTKGPPKRYGLCQCGYGGPFKLFIENRALYRQCKQCGDAKNMDEHQFND